MLASEIVAYTDNNIEPQNLEDYLASYQTKKTLSMEEIWNIGKFLEIAIIENIGEICEKKYISQIEKYKAENIVERLIENKAKSEQKFKIGPTKRIEKTIFNDMQYSFIEYMSYILKRYGKKGYSYLKALEETVELTGTTVSDVIKKEHFDIAVRKVSIGNSILSIKRIQRINFLEIFEKTNGVEELLKKDPTNVYEKMDTKTKEYYRNTIKEISKKTKISEIYITRKLLEISKENNKHIGYYLIDKGIEELYQKLNYKSKKKVKIDEEDWIIVENFVEPIINKKDFKVVQEMKVKNIGRCQKKYDYLLKGLVVCGDCGKKMTVRRRQSKGKDKGDSYENYYCCSNNIRYRNGVCSLHYFNEQKLNDLIFEHLRDSLNKYANKERMIEIGEKQFNNLNKQEDFKKEKEYYENKIKNIKVALKNIYLDKVNSIISDEEFIQFKMQLEDDKNKYREKIKDIEEKLKQDKQPKNSDYIENIIKKFLDFKNPSKQILMELIKRVEIMDNKQIKVYLNFNIDCEE